MVSTSFPHGTQRDTSWRLKCCVVSCMCGNSREVLNPQRRRGSLTSAVPLDVRDFQSGSHLPRVQLFHSLLFQNRSGFRSRMEIESSLHFWRHLQHSVKKNKIGIIWISCWKLEVEAVKWTWGKCEQSSLAKTISFHSEVAALLSAANKSWISVTSFHPPYKFCSIVHSHCSPATSCGGYWNITNCATHRNNCV